LVRGIVDQNVDGTELLDGPVDNRAAMLGILDIAGDEDTGGSCFFHQPPGFARVLVFIEVGDEHVGAFARKSESDGAADATVATRRSEAAIGVAIRSERYSRCSTSSVLCPRKAQT
jgi:hypothetical protein